MKIIRFHGDEVPAATFAKSPPFFTDIVPSASFAQSASTVDGSRKAISQFEITRYGANLFGSRYAVSQFGFGYHAIYVPTSVASARVQFSNDVAPSASFTKSGLIDATHNAVAQFGFGYRAGALVIHEQIIYRTATDHPFTAELVTKGRPPLFATESLTISETMSQSGGKIRTATDVPSTAEVLSRILSTDRFVIDHLFVSPPGSLELVEAVVARGRSTTDTLSISESARALGAFKATENLTITESATRTRDIARPVSDFLTMSQVVTTGFSRARSATDHLTTAEVAAYSALFLLRRTAVEFLSVSDIAVISTLVGPEWDYFLPFEPPVDEITNEPVYSGGFHYVHTW